MEPTDQQILALLSRDGRMSFTELGRQVGLSTSATQQRVRRLEQRGIITGYRADIDPAEVGRALSAFIQIKPLASGFDRDASQYLATLPQITSCYSVAGDASYLCLAQVGSAEELDELLARIRRELSVNTVTTIVLRTAFKHRPLV
ncbi:MAG: Lrp/AsnC family transcriptional regulator [Brooklawnia sp.]|uniref:Lrp/AsnC family transcriptional regulator n=1 Tax=Brooklawnia sp. TaxID=2699740 RepID=UPI003C706D75